MSRRRRQSSRQTSPQKRPPTPAPPDNWPPTDPATPIHLTHPTAHHIDARATPNTKTNTTINVLCIHAGHHATNLAWQPRWTTAIAQSVLRYRPDAKVACKFLMYDDLFDGENITPVTTTQALARLLATGVFYGLADLFQRRGALTQAPDTLRWTAGMVAQWVENEPLRRALRHRVLTATTNPGFTPHAVAAHSLGSLIAYDTYSQTPGHAAIAKKTLITLGSQIGNAFVRGVFGGVIRPPQNTRWYHLYNKHDNVFTAPIHLTHPTFHQIETPFDTPGPADHAAVQYLAHPAAAHHIWATIAALKHPPNQPTPRTPTRTRTRSRKPAKNNRRALLVGINDYPDPAMQLDGCVNDVFQTSALLQELGFAPEHLRTVLNKRATADNIRDRLRWLLQDTQPGDQRVFYFSGHGAQLESYGAGELIDRRDECLVPHDFDWTIQHAIVDDWLVDFYAQLDHAVSLTIILDCCHAGGMTRQPGSRVRGITPPDDIRHRGLKWNAKEQTWQPRNPPSPNPDLGSSEDSAKRRAQVRRDYLGQSGATRRLGRGLASLHTTDAQYRRACKTHNHPGPYQPLILYACREDQYAWEYRHGATTHGAFTYALNLAIRNTLNHPTPNTKNNRARNSKKRTPPTHTFESLVQQAARKLKTLGYPQHPGLFGPHPTRTTPVPWLPQT